MFKSRFSRVELSSFGRQPVAPCRSLSEHGLISARRRRSHLIHTICRPDARGGALALPRHTALIMQRLGILRGLRALVQTVVTQHRGDAKAIVGEETGAASALAFAVIPLRPPRRDCLLVAPER